MSSTATVPHLGFGLGLRTDHYEDILAGHPATAGIVSNFTYDWYMRQHPEASIRAATEFALEDDLGFDVAIGLMSADQALIDRVNASLGRMSKDGVIANALARYGIRLIPVGGTPNRK